ncbi:MAG: hypothetical protein KIS92_08985 [Planctomycetota bacterium]|nr:hypothetical protein [Planctomycetota bacterium]
MTVESSKTIARFDGVAESRTVPRQLNISTPEGAQPGEIAVARVCPSRAASIRKCCASGPMSSGRARSGGISSTRMARR